MTSEISRRKIISKTRLQYNTRLFKECGFEKEITGYAETMLRGEEALWDGTVQWIKSILESLKTTIRRVDGHPNRWPSRMATSTACLLPCRHTSTLIDSNSSSVERNRSYTERRQTGAKERRRNQDHLLTFVKRLLTIEPAPYTRLHVSKYNDSPKYSRSTGFTSTGFLCFEYHGGSIPGQAALAAVLDV